MRRENSFGKVDDVGNGWRCKEERQTTSTMARWHQGRNELHAHRTMRFNQRSRRLEEDDHGNHQKSESTWRDKVITEVSKKAKSRATYSQLDWGQMNSLASPNMPLWFPPKKHIHQRTVVQCAVLLQISSITLTTYTQFSRRNSPSICIHIPSNDWFLESSRTVLPSGRPLPCAMESLSIVK